MFGEIDFILFSISAVALVGALTDLFRRKIYNALTLTAILSGWVYHFVHGGLDGFLVSLGATLLAGILFGWIYILGHLGAGDVKFLMAFGALGGAFFVIKTALLSIFIGGAFALLLLAKSGKLILFFEKFYVFLATFLSRGVEIQKMEADKSSRMPFGIPIALAAIWNLFSNPLHLIGVYL